MIVSRKAEIGTSPSLKTIQTSDSTATVGLSEDATITGARIDLPICIMLIKLVQRHWPKQNLPVPVLPPPPPPLGREEGLRTSGWGAGEARARAAKARATMDFKSIVELIG
jgi:hypothetical protein